MDTKKTFKIKAEKALLPDNKVILAENLYPGQGIGEVRKHIKKGLQRRMIYMGVISILVLLAMIVKDSSTKKEVLEFVRNPMNQGSSSVKLTLSTGAVTDYYEMMIGSRELSDDEIDSLQQKAEEALDPIILGDNQDFLHIDSSLTLPTEVECKGEKLLLSWSSDRIDIVDSKGNVNNRNINKEVTVCLQGKIWYGQEYRVYERILTVVPPKLSLDEQKIEEALAAIEKIEGERGKEGFTLPDEIGGVKIDRAESPVHYGLVGVFFALLIPVIGYFSYFEQISEKRKQDIEQGLKDYKDFIRKLILLLSAGMSVRLAWKKLCTDRSGMEKKTLLSEALRVSLREMDSGIREEICYRRFGERMGSRPYERLAEILSQQAQKGVSHVTQVLETELKDVEEAEKEEVRVKAEKAGTALLLPIMGLLSIVFLIIMVPAFAGMSI